MLRRIGVSSMDDLFKDVPAALRHASALDIGAGLDEQTLVREFTALGDANLAAGLCCFAGGGVYDRYLPAAQRALLGRGEFLTAYTPYQPEVSQGTLQMTFEFQSMIAELMALPVATAGLYDGSTAVAEAALLSRAATRRPVVAISGALHPEYAGVLATYALPRGVDIVSLPLTMGRTDPEQIRDTLDGRPVACVIVQQPNFFGLVEDVERILAERPDGSLGVVVADPATLGVLEAPGRLGADLVVGEAQDVGLPLSFGGPYLGYMAAQPALLHRLPGRICGLGTDRGGQRGFVLTLQGREQHIRRARATSNICTNQAFCALAVSIYLALAGPQGLAELGEICLRRAHYLASELSRLPGVCLTFPDQPFFAEFSLHLPRSARTVQEALRSRGYLVGPVLGDFFPGMERDILVAVTERRQRDELDGLVAALEEVLALVSA